MNQAVSSRAIIREMDGDELVEYLENGAWDTYEELRYCVQCYAQIMGVTEVEAASILLNGDKKGKKQN